MYRRRRLGSPLWVESGRYNWSAVDHESGLQHEQDGSGTFWKAVEETCGGTMSKQLAPPDEDLAKVRFTHSVFEVLKSKRKRGEMVRQTLEEVALETPPKRRSQDS